MRIRQFRYGADNLAYLLYGKTDALAIDGGAVERILSFVEENRLALKWATQTHSHPDHTSGTRDLMDRTGAGWLDHRKLAQKGRLELEGETVGVLHTPGHTTDSVTYDAGSALISGDTLFNGTVGNCFSGDLKSFYGAVGRLLKFPADRVVYAGHDYVREAMAFARRLEPANPEIDRYLDRYDPYHVRSTLGDELKVNPYLRFNAPAMVALLRQKGLAVDTEFDRFKGVMSLG